jgi:hypothetical protein
MRRRLLDSFRVFVGVVIVFAGLGLVGLSVCAVNGWVDLDLPEWSMVLGSTWVVLGLCVIENQRLRKRLADA